MITPQVAVDAMREAFRADGEGRAHVPAVINLDVPAHRGEFHVKTALIDGVPHVAVKIASGFYDNPAKGLPSGSGLMAVFDATTGLPVALLLDNGFLTDIRTGAAGAVAAEVLAPADVRHRRRHRIRPAGPLSGALPPRRSAPSRTSSRGVPIALRLDALRQGDAGRRVRRARGGDAGSGVPRGGRPRHRHAVAHAARARRVAARRPARHRARIRLPRQAGARRRLPRPADLLVVDRLTQCASFGELRHALDAGLLRPDRVHAELGEIVAGMKPGRTTATQITIADLTGVGFQDTAIASVYLEMLKSGNLEI